MYIYIRKRTRLLYMLNLITGDTVVARLVDDMAKTDDGYSADDIDIEKASVTTAELTNEKPSTNGEHLA